ncbi:hypothetical protein AVEN_270248-1 [Araneus ventricosus]|uniref:Uncharacterized protein n=1 Tax=Araneus ventricosus TaxID=182803 RepID=A0A4Y2NRL4_ARAVE|nr:hypothetical protein AVEN_270248-1 [Araneus ventricosus]
MLAWPHISTETPWRAMSKATALRTYVENRKTALAPSFISKPQPGMATRHLAAACNIILDVRLSAALLPPRRKRVWTTSPVQRMMAGSESDARIFVAQRLRLAAVRCRAINKALGDFLLAKNGENNNGNEK